MREIKFRAYDKERKEWQYFTLLQLAQGEASLIWAKLENWGQFTGLTDKNGVKIYEGDILKSNVFSYPFIVKYDEKLGGYIAMQEKSPKEIYLLSKINNREKDDNLYHEREIEIIGDIYKSPELLK